MNDRLRIGRQLLNLLAKSKTFQVLECRILRTPNSISAKSLMSSGVREFRGTPCHTEVKYSIAGVEFQAAKQFILSSFGVQLYLS